jgi:hypothetical protein
VNKLGDDPSAPELVADRATLSPAELGGGPEGWETNHLSPMGQVESFGGVLHTALAAGGWRRRAIKIMAWSIVALPLAVLVLAIFAR